MKNRYQVSEAFKESCKANIGLNRYGRIHVVEDNIDIIGENYNGQLVDFTIEDNCYVNNKFIGTTVAKKITVNLLNPNNSIDLENKTIQAYVGIYINGELEEIPYGTYIIEKPANEEVKQKTSFTGYDYMIKFNVPYKDRVKYPIKASSLFEDICNQVGLEAGNIDFINADYMILGNPFTNGEDCRTVLSNITQLAGTFAKIGRDNKVYIGSLKNLENILIVKYVDAITVKELDLTMVKVLSGEADNADEKLDGNNYFEDFSKNEQWGGLNSLALTVSDIEGENTALDDKADIEENGLTEITIQDNYFLIDQAEREKVIAPLWNSLKGLKYLPFKTEYYGYPYLDAGDMIYIQDTKDNGYISYVFNHKFTFNGSFKGSLETPALTKTQTTYKNTFDMKTRFRRAERSIDKINGVIRDVIEEQDETSQKLTEHEQTIDGIKNTVSSVETDIANLTEQTIVSVDVEYALSNSTTVEPTTDWNTKAPTWENGKYMWQRTVTTYADGNQEISDATCISGAKGQDGENGTNGKDGINGTNGKNGEDGIGVKEIEEQYYLSTSDKTQTGGSWKTTQDAWSSGKYIWIRNKITWTDGDTTYTTPILATGLNNANQVADNTSKNLTENYYTKTQTDTQITQKADSIVSEVNKTILTATKGAVDEANSQTDEKLKGYTKTEKLGTAIEQNWEHVKIAWNQISEFIQMMIINQNASFAILDESKNIIMALDKTGLDFYETGQKFGEMGTEKTEDNKFIAFSVDGEYDSTVENGMAWGVKTKSDNKFHPIFYISDFFVPPKNSEGVMGDLILTSGRFILNSVNSSIVVGGIVINGDDLDGVFFTSEDSGEVLLQISKGNVFEYPKINILNVISFYRNQAGTNSFKIGTDKDKYCLLEDEGYLYCNDLHVNTTGNFGGNVYAKNISSDKRLKKNIKTAEKGALEKINKIKVRSFDWKEDNNHINYGFIAQEVNKIDENFVLKQEVLNENKEIVDYRYYINTLPILATTVKAMQEQQEQIKNLQEKEKEKDEIIKSMLKRIETLEKEVKNERNN